MALAATVDTFSIGRVISRTFNAIGRNAIPFFGLGLLAAIPQAAFGWVMQRSIAPGGAINPAAVNGAFWLNFAGSMLLALILVYFLQAALVQATVRFLNGQRVSIGEAFMTAVRVILPLIALGIVASLGIALGFVLLIVPGLMLACAWAVCVPALVVERTGIFGSLSRSAELTKGHRWSVFGLYVLYVVALVVINLALTPIVGGSLMGGQPGNMSIAALVVTVVYTAIQYTVSATGTASLYYELRSVKEGIGPEHLASVFE